MGLRNCDYIYIAVVFDNAKNNGFIEPMKITCAQIVVGDITKNILTSKQKLNQNQTDDSLTKTYMSKCTYSFKKIIPLEKLLKNYY